MKTIKEWFLELPEGVKQKALSNLNQEVKDLKVTSLSTALARGFSWSGSPEGLLYWESVGLNSGAPLPTTFEVLSSGICQWAKERDINNPSNQLLKVFEEAGELSASYLKGKTAEEKDAVGDVLVTLIIYCNIRGLNLNECLSLAWNEIKNRKGVNVNGTFIKDEADNTTPN
jgi:NTP pyrophosphatase (non-canonical NTP hydrolase)